MMDASYPALSAIKAFGQKLAVTANNIANMNTDGFKKSRVVLEEARRSGVTVSVNQINTPGTALPAEDGTRQVRESSNVAIEEEVCNLIDASNAFSTNLKTLKTEDEMMDNLIDVFG